MRRLQIVFHFRDDDHQQDALFAPFWQCDAQGARWLCYSVRARQKGAEIVTSRRFLREDGEPLP
ncbi:DUF2813 domain-containing protein [Candidatus Pantoea persica]|uniref:DUF2813 domain-containing protein n=1 Tax=Candidatus Pantoea persica TaxID=2518128 RepID=UPI00403DB375|nr:ATP-dependent endonuclease [Candidatus Pantoea persica]